MMIISSIFRMTILRRENTSSYFEHRVGIGSSVGGGGGGGGGVS